MSAIKTYEALMHRPIQGNIYWRDIIDLFKSFQCIVEISHFDSSHFIIFYYESLYCSFHNVKINGLASRKNVDNLRIFMNEVEKYRIRKNNRG